MENVETEATMLLESIIESLPKFIDNHKQADREWFHKLLDHNKTNEANSADIEAGITINITIIDCIVARLLDMDFRQLAKIKIVRDYLSQLWIDNGLDTELLNSHIIDDSVARDFYETHSKPANANTSLLPSPNNVYTVTTTTTQESNPENTLLTCEQPIEEVIMEENLLTNEIASNILPICEQSVEEVIMEEKSSTEETTIEKNNTKNQPDSSSETEHNMKTNSVLGHDILSIRNYSTRNRVATGINPFFLDKKGRFIAGAITANIPGTNGFEQLSYMAHVLKIPKNSDLIKYDFHKGNSWITFNFETEEDMEDCIAKLNGKNHEQFKIYQIHPGNKLKDQPEQQQ